VVKTKENIEYPTHFSEILDAGIDHDDTLIA